MSTDGIPRNRWDYARQFAALGHEVHIITSGESESEEVTEGVYIHRIQSSDRDLPENIFSGLALPEFVNNHLSYSYLVYKRIKSLNELQPVHLIESPLWDVEGYITRLRLPEIPFIVRLETTSMLLKEILTMRTPKKDLLNEIETHFLQIATGYVFDSWSIFKETERLYKMRFDKKPYAVVHHGIDLGRDMPCVPSVISREKGFKVLSVGRLEKRKGSDILIKEILPLLMKSEPDIEIHLAGKDSGEWDGFKEETGFTYHEYIRTHFKEYLNRRIFIYGYVSDAKLDDLYKNADLVLALSRYESFGLLYLEAMRKGKPLIVFNTGAVPEIFDDGQDAIVLPPDQPEKVVASIIRLKGDAGFRFELGKNAQKKLVEKFSAERMAKECLRFFEEIAFKKIKGRIFQVMNCLTDRDGVSNITIDFDKLLKEQGEATKILSTSASAAVQHLVSPIEKTHFTEADLIFYHYWNYCERGEYFNGLTLPGKIFFFHNMTTPSFFSPDDEAFTTTSKGFRQLGNLTDFDVYVGHSSYSLEILRQSVRKPIRTQIIPPYIEGELILNRPYQQALVEQLAGRSFFHIIFVGSIAPHKKQTDLVRFFHYYSRMVNAESHLTIIGGGSKKYADELESLIRELDLVKQVTVTGKVSNEELYAYYRTADVYLSMSEHEGFGIPLAEAMVFEIPVVAYNCTAIPDTVGDNGCLFDRKDPVGISALLERIKTDKQWRRLVLEKQREQLTNFSRQSVIRAFEELFDIARDLHLERLSLIKSQPGYLVEEFVYHSDPRFSKGRNPQYIDNQFLMVESGDLIHLTEQFSDIECCFLSHEWSGKVNIRVDDLPAREIDLFFPGRKVRAIPLHLELMPGKHTLQIWPSAERSSFSKGNEILLHWIKFMKPLSNVLMIESPIEEKEEFVPSDKGEGLGSDYEEVLSNRSPGDEKIVRFSEETGALSDLFVFEGDWAIRDGTFRLSDASSSSGCITFEKEFVNLELLFIVHAWSGMVEVSVDDSCKEIIDLYRAEHSKVRIKLKRKFRQDKHHVIIRTLSRKNGSSKGLEVLFGGIAVEQHIPIEISEEKLEADYKVSVIINTLDRAEHLEKLLKDLERQTYRYFEIVAVNGPSKDRTMDILNGYNGRLKIAHCPEANLSQSRNIGIEYAAGDYVAFIDDDALPCNEYWVENFIHFIIWKRQMKIGAVGGPVKHRDTDHYEFKNGATSDYGIQIFREEDLNNHVLDGKRWVQGVPGGNNIILKKALYEINGFDERFIYYLDETDMCIRLARKGYAIMNQPVNHIRHFKAPSTVRKSSYDLRWDIIARSDMYYALKNGLDPLPVKLFKAIALFRKKHFYREVVKAYKDGKIQAEEYKKYRKLFKKGFFEGIKWGLSGKDKQQGLRTNNSAFQYFRQLQHVSAEPALSI